MINNKFKVQPTNQKNTFTLFTPFMRNDFHKTLNPSN